MFEYLNQINFMSCQPNLRSLVNFFHLVIYEICFDLINMIIYFKCLCAEKRKLFQINRINS